jgi:hypothetical protein
MKITTIAAGLAAALFFGAAAIGIDAAVDTTRTLMSRPDHDRALRDIERTTRAALAQCRGGVESSRELCRTRARAEDRIARADLEARYFGTVEAEANARMVRAHARFDVARSECFAQASTGRAQCLSEARNGEAKAVALARLAST